MWAKQNGTRVKQWSHYIRDEGENDSERHKKTLKTYLDRTCDVAKRKSTGWACNQVKIFSASSTQNYVKHRLSNHLLGNPPIDSHKRANSITITRKYHINLCKTRSDIQLLGMIWTCSNIHDKEGNSTKSGVLKWLCLFLRQISTAFISSCSPEFQKQLWENNFRLGAWKLLLDNNADLALVQHVVEGSSLPLLVPVVHLPHATGNQPKGESNEDLLHHTRALEGGMCNPATCHLLAVEVRCQMPERNGEDSVSLRGSNRQTAYLHQGKKILLINADMCIQQRRILIICLVTPKRGLIWFVHSKSGPEMVP